MTEKSDKKEEPSKEEISEMDPKAEQEKLKSMEPIFPTTGVLSSLNPGISFVISLLTNSFELSQSDGNYTAKLHLCLNGSLYIRPYFCGLAIRQS